MNCFNQSSICVVFGFLMLISSGCGSKPAADEASTPIDHGEVTLSEFPLRKLAVAHGHRIDCRHDHFLAIRKNGKLHLMVGGTKAGKYVGDTLTAFDPGGKQVWKLGGKYSDNNPRPYTGKSANVNDRELAMNFGSVVADLDGDGVDDIYSAKGRQRTGHVALISGASGNIIVQSKIDGHPNLTSPYAVFDFDLDGTHDLHFCSRGEKNHARVISFSGSDLTILRDEQIELKYGVSALALPGLPDENDDGINEVLLHHKFKNNGKDVLSVVDGKTFEVRRTFEEADINRIRSSRFFLSPGDIDGDGLGEFVICMRTGSKSNKNAGYIACYSGVDGSELWYLESEELGGPKQEHLERVDDELVPSGEYNIVNRLGDYGAMIRDLNSDSTREIVVALSYENQMPQRQRTLVVISGKDGSIMKKIELPNVWADEVVIPLSNPENSSGTVILGMNGSLKQKGSNLLKVEF